MRLFLSWPTLDITPSQDVSADSGVRRLPSFPYPAAASSAGIKYEVLYLTVSLVFEFSRAKNKKWVRLSSPKANLMPEARAHG